MSPTKIQKEKVESKRYRVLPGPEGFLSPAAATLGVVLPDPGQGLVEGEIVSEDQAIEAAAKKLLSAKHPTLFPGPAVLWDWKPEASKLATATKRLAEAIPAKIIPMADYRPKYPRVYPEIEINPNHPNLTIWHNKIDVCLFIGVHCHQANIALKIIRAGTSCYTIAMCSFSGDDEANITVRDITPETMERLITAVLKMKKR
ncbi:MAG: carbon monoxide dehydrogenase [Nitrospirae bacterium]|nr:carbon monoxide dehydrogenase [Nitrospirota bacterium]MBI3352876.1 carbon monoxide dehydrogenase [Nitrospirota bacterium]